MKIGVINYSGNVGKTLISSLVLQPRLGYEVLTIESINSNDVDQEAASLKSNDFIDIQTELLMNDDLIVDIGASNVEALIDLMRKSKGSIDDYDYFIVPVLPNKKIQTDSTNTILTLIDLGIDRNKIIVVFNSVPDDCDISQDFETILDFLKEENVRFSKIPVYKSSFFNHLEETKIKYSFKELIQLLPKKDEIKKSLSSISDPVEKRNTALVIPVLRSLDSFINELQDAFDGIMDVINKS